MKRSERKFTLIEKVVALCLIVALVVFVLPLLAGLGAERRGPRRSSANTLKQMGIVFSMYAYEHDGQYPPLTPYKHVWMVDLERLYLEFITDLTVLVRQDLPDSRALVQELEKLALESPVNWERITRITARSYTYINWLVRDDSEAEELKKGYMRLAKEDLDTDFRSGDRTFYHLREGIERLMITDINNPAASATARSGIPVMFETVRRKRHPHSRRKIHGYNVLYLDGHVEFVKYGERFPATGAVADTFPPPGP